MFNFQATKPDAIKSGEPSFKSGEPWSPTPPTQLRSSLLATPAVDTLWGVKPDISNMSHHLPPICTESENFAPDSTALPSAMPVGNSKHMPMFQNIHSQNETVFQKLRRRHKVRRRHHRTPMRLAAFLYTCMPHPWTRDCPQTLITKFHSRAGCMKPSTPTAGRQCGVDCHHNQRYGVPTPGPLA